MKTLVTLSRGGSGETTIEAARIQIHDLWHIAQAQAEPETRKAILDVWHLAHDLKDHIVTQGGGGQ